LELGVKSKLKRCNPRNAKPLNPMAGATGIPQNNNINDLDRQTPVTAHTENKSISGAVANPRDAADPVIATCAKGPRQEFRLTLKTFGGGSGGRKFELQIFEKNGRGEFMPTKRRVVFAPAYVRDLIGIIEKGKDFVVGEGLLPP
jgi:hypothetical protein